MAAWDSSFENDPGNSDDRSEGALRIRETRQEASDRLETEHDAGPDHISGGGSDDGRHLEGSARAFYVTSNPTTLNDPASTAIGASDSGRIAVRSDQQNRALVWDGVATAWEPLRTASISATEAAILTLGAGGHDGMVAFATDTRRTWISDGSSWQVAAGDEAVSDTDTTTTTVAGGGGTAWTPVGGSNLALAVPSAGSFVIEVYGMAGIIETTGTSGTGKLHIDEDVAGGGFSSVAVGRQTSAGAVAGEGGQVSLHFTRTSPTNGSTYTYRLRGVDGGGGTWSFADTVRLTAVLRPLAA